MKKWIFLLITTFIFLINYAQNEFLDYVVTKNKDTIYGKINRDVYKITDFNGEKHKIKINNIVVLRKNDMIFIVDTIRLNSMFKKQIKDSVYVLERLNSDDEFGKGIFKRKVVSYVNRQKRLKDYIVTFENDTIYGEISKRLNYNAMLKNKSGKKIRISTKVVKKYRWNNYFFYNKKKAAVMIGDRKNAFLKLLLNSEIKLYEYKLLISNQMMNFVGNNSISYENAIYYYLEIDGKLKYVPRSRFLKIMVQVLKKDKDLVKRIKKREFHYSNMYLLIKEYNARN